MSLLEEAMTKCVMLDKKTVPDGYGGFTSEWTEGAEFMAAVRFDTSMTAKIAEKQGVTSLYTIITPKETTLEFNDVIKRISDGKILRVTSKGEDSKTPDSASLDMRTVSAEEWEIPR